MLLEQERGNPIDLKALKVDGVDGGTMSVGKMNPRWQLAYMPYDGEVRGYRVVEVW